jgi:hypothetical protein
MSELRGRASNTRGISQEIARRSGQRTTQPLTVAEVAAVRDLAASGTSRRAIAMALGIGRSSVARVLDCAQQRTRKRPTKVAKAGRPAAAGIRPRHATARQFSRAWHVQCDRAFKAAMQATGAIAHSQENSLGHPNQKKGKSIPEPIP